MTSRNSKASPLLWLLAVLTLSLSGCGYWDKTRYARDWEVYKGRFIHAEGRVVDTGNQGISHSEGQGIAMLLAQRADDRQTFERLWAWTQRELQARDDHLFRWRRRPDVTSEAEDPNNATDGDLLIAWALLRGGASWDRPDYLQAGKAVLTDIRSKLIRDWQGLKILLPGSNGFEHGGVLTVNLSYWIYPAFKDFARFDTEPEIWSTVADGGLRLLELARFGTWSLPPDWLSLTSPPAPAASYRPVFGYDAVRIPLYLRWAGHRGATLEPFTTYWNTHAPFVPAWVHLSENCIDGIGAPSGIKAIRLLTVGTGLRITDPFPHITEADDYYSASLILLSRLADLERGS